MGRRIVTVSYQKAAAAGQPPKIDTYFDQVLKYIPGDVVSAWVFVSSLIKQAPNDIPKDNVNWVVFAVGIVATAVWTLYQTSDPPRPLAWKQSLVATFAFIVWVFALGETSPFASLSFYRPLYGSLVLVGFTLFAPLLAHVFQLKD